MSAGERERERDPNKMKKRFTADTPQNKMVHLRKNSQERDATFFSLFSEIREMVVATVFESNEGGRCNCSKACAYSGSEVNIGVYFHSRNTGCALIQQLIC